MTTILDANECPASDLRFVTFASISTTPNSSIEPSTTCSVQMLTTTGSSLLNNDGLTDDVMRFLPGVAEQRSTACVAKLVQAFREIL